MLGNCASLHICSVNISRSGMITGGSINFTRKLLVVAIPPFLAISSTKFFTDTLNTYIGTVIFMAYSGLYKPIHPRKYRGNPTRIVYRSLWERKFMVYCDSHDHIIEWGSEEFSIPYRDPVSGRRRRYFPDFYIKYIDRSKTTRRTVSYTHLTLPTKA